MELIFILIEPAVPENIGSAARALKTMGFSRLRLVNPQADHLGTRAKMLAHGSHDVLKKAKVYKKLSSAARDLDLLVATSSKDRKTHIDPIPGNRLRSFLMNKNDFIGKAGIIFGSEETGLSNDDLKACDIISYLPIAQSYPSLNLSQAVMLYAYLLSPLNKPAIKKSRQSNVISKDNLKSLKGKIDGIMGIVKINNKDIIGPRILERITFLSNDDLQLMHSFCNAFLKKYPSNSKQKDRSK
jgi:tRNA/rRNA methyltransferase